MFLKHGTEVHTLQLLPTSSVGKKLLMAVSGQVMIIFIIIHMLGNSTIFFQGLNTYAAALHSLPALVWLTRTVMLTMLALHMYLSIQLTMENRKAKPESYAVKKHLRSTFASKNMIWTGLVIGVFLVYHLLHFTFQVTNPDISAFRNPDAAGRPDVAAMVILSFNRICIALTYIIAVIGLTLHLSHGIQSTFQTLGLNNDRTLPVISKAGSAAAVIILLGYISIPVIIFLGIMKG